MERGKDGTFLLGLVGLLTTKRYRNSPPCGAPPRRELDDEEKEKVTARARGYEDLHEFFMSTLAQGVAMIAAAFYPKPIIVRFSDFKTNEYANLLGGKHYEPKRRSLPPLSSSSFPPSFPPPSLFTPPPLPRLSIPPLKQPNAQLARGVALLQPKPTARSSRSSTRR